MHQHIPLQSFYMTSLCSACMLPVTALGQAEIVTFGTEKAAPTWLEERERKGRKEQSKHAKVGSTTFQSSNPTIC